MMATGTSDSGSVIKHMHGVRLKMVQQKIQNEKDRIVNRPESVESTNNDIENEARLQQAMLRRQELLDKIRREQLLNEENKRPRSYSAHRRYTPSPMQLPQSRRSLQDFAKYNMYNQAPDTHRSKPEMSQMKYVIEHKFESPRQPQQYPLPPITQRPQILPGAPPPVIVHQQQQPQIIPMQQPNPQIIQVPAPQHIIAGNPSPVIHNLGDRGPPENKGMFNKSDFGEMMMWQNCQMHQMVMQKLMLGSLGRQDNDHHGGCHDCNDCNDCHSGCCSSHGVHGGFCGNGGGGCYDCLPVPRLAGGAVHHHHYSNPPPPSQPAVSHYQTMPAMQLRDPYAGYASSAYTGPGYAYDGYDGGENYYTYH